MNKSILENSKKEKLNLITAISKNNILYYKLNDTNTAADIFLKFMIKLNEYLKNNNK